MPAIIRKIEEPGCDISGLKKLLAEVEEAERLEKPARPSEIEAVVR